MTYEEAIAYIDETPKFTTKHSLNHTKECLRRLGNPEKNFRVIHVAGTNGKGSTCAFLYSILRSGGYSCGLFTSPHLVDIEERFQINGANVERETFLRVFERVKNFSQQLEEEGIGHPTYFEMIFLMGMVMYAEAGVDYVILETGLGGRLDATSAIENPVACVITSVSLDHMQYLGNTVEEIAGEKAGIIVPGVPVIYDGNDRKAAAVIEQHAKECQSPYYEILSSQGEILKNTREGIVFRRVEDQEEFSIPFIAAYQVTNALLAIKTMEVLREVLPVSKETIQEGIRNTRWAGRMENILPGVIVDGAHNEDGVRRFVETAEHFQKDYSLTLLFSAVEDKDYVDMIHTICSRIRFRKVYTTQVGGYRQVDAKILADLFRKEGCTDVVSEPDTDRAFLGALDAKGEEGLLFCVGSLYLVGNIKAVIGRKE
ncbi:MAG: folylpolyglutamate synthase/dihydrofolate synthase family protein [Eubacteriales bacterium]|nr:folylpolyglutamate synthase/dihydrofolate synthase family protein [Eubacteriales bacterium]